MQRCEGPPQHGREPILWSRTGLNGCISTHGKCFLERHLVLFLQEKAFYQLTIFTTDSLMLVT